MSERNPYFTRRFRKLPDKIDLGCGTKCAPGFSGIDIQDNGQDLVWDIREGLPFPDSSIRSVFSSHFIEHMTDAQVQNLFQEILRVCSVGASVVLSCPHSGQPEAWFHNHLSQWSVLRIKGMVQGFLGSSHRYGGKCFKIESAQQAGMELQAKLTVISKP